jgi:hypothetical protein
MWYKYHVQASWIGTFKILGIFLVHLISCFLLKRQNYSWLLTNLRGDKMKIYAAILLLPFFIISCGGGGGGSSSSGEVGSILVSIAVTPANPNITTGTTQQFTATGMYSNGTAQNITSTVTWNSSSTGVATIAGTAGLSTSISAGATIITATSGSISGSTLLTVTDTLLLPVPTGVRTAAASGQVTIIWDGGTGATSYNIYWSTTPGVTKTAGTKISGINHSSYTHTGLTNGTTYYYIVTAQYPTGESNESIQVSDTPSNLITVNIVAPSGGALAGNTLQISVTSASTYQIQSITANIVDRQTSLVFSNQATCHGVVCSPGWLGTISLSGLARGNQLLTVTAKDYYGNIATVSTEFVFDQKPSLVINNPVNDTVARPQLHIVASCTDDDSAGCKSLTVTTGSYPPGPPRPVTVIASGRTSIDQTVSLASYDGTWIFLSFNATDSAGQVSTDLRTVFIESSTKLVEVASVTSPIWDVQLWDLQPGRVLFLDISGGENILKIRDRSSGVDTIIRNQPGIIPQHGFLTPKGAIFVEQSGNVLTSVIQEWRDGVLVDLGYPNSSNSLKVQGNYAIWNKQPLLILRDLVSGSNKTIATDAGNWMNDVASNGDIVYWSTSYQIYRHRGSVTTQLTNDSLWNTYPLTDGVNVFYRKHTPCCSNQTYQIAMYTASGEHLLTPAGTKQPMPYADYQVNNSWAAFTKPGTDGVFQIWRRSPAGYLTQLSFFGTSSSIDTLASNGDMTWISGKRRYLSISGGLPVDVGSYLGKSIFQGGQWYVIIGKSLFSIAP